MTDSISMIPEFKSSSQHGQDRFPYELIVKPEGKLDGTFLDIGCNDPVSCNNTYALEQLGWRGLLNDIIHDCTRSCAVRKSPFVLGDATKMNWRDVLQAHNLYHDAIDYLSLDVDAATLATLKNLPLGRIKFRTITVEHDSYIYGPGPRDEMRSILFSLGYALTCADVMAGENSPFEDWWICPGTVDMQIANKLACEGALAANVFAI